MLPFSYHRIVSIFQKLKMISVLKVLVLAACCVDMLPPVSAAMARPPSAVIYQGKALHFLVKTPRI